VPSSSGQCQRAQHTIRANITIHVVVWLCLSGFVVSCLLLRFAVGRRRAHRSNRSKPVVDESPKRIVVVSSLIRDFVRYSTRYLSRSFRSLWHDSHYAFRSRRGKYYTTIRTIAQKPRDANRVVLSTRTTSQETDRPTRPKMVCSFVSLSLSLSLC
jgi:hypothetical protein